MKLDIQVITEYPVAFDSPDHITPWGTARDNSSNKRFNQKLYRLYSFLNRFPKILDLGCSGGGFVKTCLDDGCLAVGIEGSDHSKEHLRAEWPILQDRFLFTADITRKFEVMLHQKKLLFDVITIWEVMEHLPKDRLSVVCQNIHTHLEEHGLVVMSIASTEEQIWGNALHLTVQEKEKWIQLFEQNKLYPLGGYEAFFNTQYVRGPKQNAPGSFHVFLAKNPLKVPSPPKIALKEWLIDRWLLSRPHKVIKKLIVEP